MPEVVMAESCHRGWGGQKIQDARDRLLQRLAYDNRSHFIQNTVAIERSPKSIPMVS